MAEAVEPMVLGGPTVPVVASPMVLAAEDTMALVDTTVLVVVVVVVGTMVLVVGTIPICSAVQHGFRPALCCC